MRYQIDDPISAAGAAPAVVMETPSSTIACALIAAGAGVTIVSITGGVSKPGSLFRQGRTPESRLGDHATAAIVRNSRAVFVTLKTSGFAVRAIARIVGCRSGI